MLGAYRKFQEEKGPIKDQALEGCFVLKGKSNSTFGFQDLAPAYDTSYLVKAPPNRGATAAFSTLETGDGNSFPLLLLQSEALCLR